MPLETLHIPLRMPSEKGFFSHTPGQQTFLGHPVRLSFEGSYLYLVIEQVLADKVDALLRDVKRCITWAAVRLDQGIITDSGPLQRAETGIFNGQFSTAYPENSQAHPIRATGQMRIEEPSTRLFAAMNEAVEKTNITKSEQAAPIIIACELFAAADFEDSVNSRFLLLSTVFEVLANPKKRPKVCVDLVDELLHGARTMDANDNADTRIALEDLIKSAHHLKQESIRSSVRQLATEASKALGDPEPQITGRQAVDLYDKRSTLVHKGQNVTWNDVTAIRKLARECLAVKVGCYSTIRERFT